MESTRAPPPPTAQLFQVFLRLRPSSPQSSVSETPFLTTATGQNFVYVTPPQERNRFRAIEKFGFTRIFDELSEQKDVFAETVMPLLQQAINGRDGTLATLGVTGSGKVGLLTPLNNCIGANIQGSNRTVDTYNTWQ